MEPPEPDHKFIEIIKVNRDYHWCSDVTIYYKSETRSKATFSPPVASSRPLKSTQFRFVSMVFEFKVEGGCKLKENSAADYRQVWIRMANGRHTFKVTRFKTGGKISY